MQKNALVLLLAFCVRYASSIHCYDCTSQNNSMCLDPTIYDEDTLRKFMTLSECSRGLYSGDHARKFFCRKIVQTILHKGYEPEVRVTRSCGWIRHHKDCYKADNEDHLETVCQCFADGCNGAAGVRAGVVIMVVLCAISKIIM